MEFLLANMLNTTTMLTVVGGGSALVPYLFDKGTRLGWSSSGFNDDATSGVLSITLPSNTVISHIMLQKHNLKDFRVYYNSVTANSLFATTTNSDSSTYIAFASVTVNSIDIQMNKTISPNQEKQVGELYIGYRIVQFERNPAIENYQQKTVRKQIIHEMPDGGQIAYNIKDKFQANLAWQFITATFMGQLQSVYSTAQPVQFVPFPTSTGWDGAAYEVIFTGDFDFQYGANVKSQGYSGSLAIAQTPGG